MAGGKLTAYRSMAERIVDDLVADLGTGATRCRTADVALVGGDVDVDGLVARLAGRPGTANVDDARRLVELWGSEAERIAADGGGVDAEVRHAVLHEGALRLEDYWIRRGARAWFTDDPVGDDLEVAAAAMAELLGWSPVRLSDEVASCRRIHADSMRCLPDLGSTPLSEHVDDAVDEDRDQQPAATP